VIHTMDISCWLSEYQFQMILDEQGATQDSLQYETTAYAPSGISALRLYRVDRADFQSQYLQISMNPQFVITGASDPMALFDPLDFAELVPAFREVLETITNVRTPPLPKWYAARIDYAMDTQVNNSATRPAAQQYVELARRGFLPLRAEVIGRPEWVSYAAANNSSVVSVYSRGPALRARFLGLDEEVYCAADDLLRLEVRCEKQRLSSIRQRYHFPNRQLQHFMTHPEIGQAELSRQARRIFGVHDYRTFRRNAAIINRAPGLQRRTKAAMKDLLKAFEVATGTIPAQREGDSPIQIFGIPAARLAWSNGRPVYARLARRRIAALFSPWQVGRLIRRLRELGINPVSLPMLSTRANPAALLQLGQVQHPFPELVAGTMP